MAWHSSGVSRCFRTAQPCASRSVSACAQSSASTRPAMSLDGTGRMVLAVAVMRAMWQLTTAVATRFPAICPSLQAKRSNPSLGLLRHGLLRRFAPRNDDELSTHRQRRNVVSVADGTLEHRVFQLALEPLGRADATFRRERAAEHHAAVGQLAAVKTLGQQVL